jgi:anti-anti-sigma factor
MIKKSEITSFEQDAVVTIILPEKIDYSLHAEFRKTYSKYKQNTQYILDFGNVSYIDSAALGMLLFLREYNGASKGEHNSNPSKIAIINCKREILNIFKIANFSKLFDLR